MNVRDDWSFRGLIHLTTDEEVFDRLSAGTVTVYAGFDPTASSLHLGHLFPLCNLPATPPSPWPVEGRA